MSIDKGNLAKREDSPMEIKDKDKKKAPKRAKYKGFSEDNKKRSAIRIDDECPNSLSFGM